MFPMMCRGGIVVFHPSNILVAAALSWETASRPGAFGAAAGGLGTGWPWPKPFRHSQPPSNASVRRKDFFMGDSTAAEQKFRPRSIQIGGHDSYPDICLSTTESA